ncbi:MAG: DUF501 domain-containing protein [Acidimicrobiales bacterium]
MTRGPSKDITVCEETVVAELLGRRPLGRFEVARRCANGAPAVIKNAPFLDDGSPMPTLYWLVEPTVRAEVSRIESRGGVRQAEAEVDPDALAQAHHAYAAARDALLEGHHVGPVPSGGVGGTRRGVKCLHAHLAFWLVGGADPVGDWVSVRIPGLLEPMGLDRPR